MPQDGLEVLSVPYKPPLPLRMARLFASRRKSQNGPSRETPTYIGRLRSAAGIYSCARMPDETDPWVAPAFRAALRASPWDVVVSSSSPYTTHRVARRLRESGAARFWVADFRDLWTRNPVFQGLFPFTLIERLEERRCLREADLVTTVSEPLASVLSAESSSPALVVPNGLDTELWVHPSKPAVTRDGLIRLVYTGSLYSRGRDPGLLLRALKDIDRRAPEVARRFRLVVAGHSFEIWKSLAGRYGVLHLLDSRGVVDRRESWHLQGEATCLILLGWQGVDEGLMTSKIYEYLFAQAPILAIGGRTDSCVGQLLASAGRGYHCGNSVPCVVDFLIRLAQDPESIQRTPDPVVLARYTREKVALDLLDMIRTNAGASVGG